MENNIAMGLKFLGTGSAFNTEYGNNSAYYKQGNILLLIDCGETVFAEIQKRDLLEGVDHLFITITHLHSDHIGSLSSLILYCHYLLDIKPVVFYPDNSINTILSSMDVVKDTMYTHEANEKLVIQELGIALVLDETEHVKNMKSYYVVIQDILGFKCNIYYSGDTNTINETDLKFLNNGFFRYFYQDTSSFDYEGNVHLSFEKLKELVDPDMRHRVWCMHLDGKLTKEEIEAEGFKVVEKEHFYAKLK